MTGYAQLWGASPGAWSGAAAAWAGLVAPVERRRTGLGGQVTTLRDGWTGGAAAAAGGRLDRHRGELAGLLPAVLEADQVLAEFAGRLRVAKARLADAVALADRTGVEVDRHGRCSAAPPVAVDQVAAAVRDALALADAADRETATRLDELSGAARAGWLTPPPPGRPSVDAEPAAVRAWWAALTPAQRRWLTVHEPQLVGRLDGVPVAARDQANRLLLAGHREALLARRQELLRRFPLGAGELTAVRRAEESLAGLDALAGRLAVERAPRAYLLGLERAGDGRAIVALGNPDRADRVLTYVPGMTADLGDVPGELSRAGRVLARCTTIAPGEETSAVLWLDYDAPDFLPEAARSDQARDAAPALHRFQEGLRATHDGPPARQTVLGHSYGSVVVGAAARDHGLGADALVFVGSPGVGVDRAEALGLPAGQVWSSTAPDDVIRLVEPPGQLAGRAVLAASPLATAVSLLRPSDHELWFGHDPSDPGFGGRTFPSGRYGHTGYWEPGNPALDGMARIVLGR